MLDRFLSSLGFAESGLFFQSTARIRILNIFALGNLYISPSFRPPFHIYSLFWLWGDIIGSEKKKKTEVDSWSSRVVDWHM